MKRLILIMLLGIFLFSFASAEPHKQNTDYELTVSSNYATECQMSYIKYPDGTSTIYNRNLTKDDTSFYTTVNGTNFTQLGDTCMNVKCVFGTEIQTDNICLDVTASGTKPEMSDGIANLLLILFFGVLIFGLYSATSKINFESWHNSIIRKYENKNYVKLVLASIAYNIMKHTYIIYYLLGFPLILLLTDIAYTFGVTSMVDILGVLLYIYTAGSLIVGIYFFGHVQEWLMMVLTQIKDMDWGVR